MKLKKTILLLSALFMLMLCVNFVCASDDANGAILSDNDSSISDSVDDVQVIENDSGTSSDDGNVESDESSNESANDVETAAPATGANAPVSANTKKTDAWGLCSNAFIQKSNKYYTVKVCTFNEKKNKLDFHKNVKLIVKIKFGKKTKTYKVKTNKKGEAKILNVKNLKVGTYKVTVKSDDAKFNVNEKGYLGIFSKKTKSLTLKMNKNKKVKGDIIMTFYEPKDGQNPKGVYVTTFNEKDMNLESHCLILKAKFFFKNKKTGKIISKTYKSKENKIYGWIFPVSKLIKGYTPIKTKIWYTVSK